MKKLLVSEWHKLWQSRSFFMPFIILVVLNLIMLPLNLGNKVMSYSGSAYRQIQADLLSLTMPQKGEFLNAHLQQIQGIYRIDSIVRTEASQGKPLTAERERYASDINNYWDLYISKQYLSYCENIEQEYAFLRQIRSEYDTVNGYGQFLNNIIGQADQLADISIFKNSSNAFHERNSNETAKIYSQLADIKVNFIPQRGIVTILNYSVTDFLFLALVFFLSVSISRNEKDNGLLCLVRSTKRGRTTTAMVKVVAMASCLFVLTLLFYGINFVYSQTTFGLGNLSAPVQSVALLQKCPLDISVAGYILLFLFLKCLAAIVIGTWVMCSVYYPKYTLSAYLFSTSFIAVGFLLKYLVSSSSGLAFLRYANLITPFFVNEYLGEYKNIDVLGNPCNTTFIIGLTLIILLTGFILFFCFEYQYLEVTTNSSRSILPQRVFLKHIYSSITRQELYKLFITNGSLGILIVFIAINAILSYQTQYGVDSDEIYYRQYMEQFQGKLDSAKYNLLKSENQEFMPLAELEYAFSNNRITFDAYTELRNAYPELQMKQQAFSKLLSRYTYLKDISEYYLVYESGYYKLFGNDTDENLTDTLLCCITCIFTLSGFLAIEKNSGMEKILSSVPLGRTKTTRRKIIISLVVTAAVTTLNLFFRYWNVLRIFEMDFIHASLRSLPLYQNSIDIPIIVAMLIQAFARLIALSTVSAVTLVISYKIGNQLLSGVIGAAVFCIPILLKSTKAGEAIWFSAYPLFNSAVLLQHGIGIFVLLLYCIMASVIIFCSTTYISITFAQPPLPH